ncbi:MAG: hypothetical protein AABZ10_02175 [Nitrospirota bacterium]
MDTVSGNTVGNANSDQMTAACVSHDTGMTTAVQWFARRGRCLLNVIVCIALSATIAAASAAPAADDVGNASLSGTGVAGVWMGFVTTVMGFNKPMSTGKPQPRWRVFLNNGVLLTQMPNDGLLALDLAARAANKNQDPHWHEYTFAGSSGATRKAGTTVSWRLDLLKPNELRMNAGGPILLPGAFSNQMSWTYENAVFYRCPRVDGLRLDGSWTTWYDPKDPQLESMAPGQRPIIHFRRDGHFVDDGVFSAFGTGRPGGVDNPGRGTYELRNYTLILRFDDGRVRNEAFTGLLGSDPATANEVIYIRKMAMKKR